MTDTAALPDNIVTLNADTSRLWVHHDGTITAHGRHEPAPATVAVEASFDRRFNRDPRPMYLLVDELADQLTQTWGDALDDAADAEDRAGLQQWLTAQAQWFQADAADLGLDDTVNTGAD